MSSSHQEEVHFIPLTGVGEGDVSLIAEYFTGDMLTWAAKRVAVLGDVIIPKIIYVEQIDGQQHKVAWVEHQGTNTLTREEFHNHHVVCDCVLCKRFDDGNGGIDTSLCESMTRALEIKGQLVGSNFQEHIGDYVEHGLTNLMLSRNEEVSDFDLETMTVFALENVLRSDKKNPENWHGNAVSGTFSISEASAIVDQPIPRTMKAASLLRRSGKADFDGENLSLAA